MEGLWQLDLGTGTASSSLSLRPIPWTPTAPSIPFPTTSPPESLEAAAALLLAALDAAVRRRVASVPPPPPPQDADEDRESFDGARIGVLFSGGLDCQVLAALAHRHAPPGEPVDLVNVCFDAANGHRSPDRLGALAGVAELRRACPGREWRLVCVDVPYAEVCGVEARVKRLIHPCATPMDFNIAVSFYAAARARGRLVPPSIVAEGVEGAGAASGLLRYGQAEEAGAAAAAAASAVAAAVEEESHGPCGNWECRRVGKPGCRRRLCGHCCTRVQRRALEALEGEEEEAEGRAARAAAILCQGHKLGKKYLPPWLTQHKQHKQQQHAPAATLPPNPAVAATATATGIPYRSRARALLLGIGADEQLAGYGRHRSTFARGGFEALERELAFDLDRLWTRCVPCG